MFLLRLQDKNLQLKTSNKRVNYDWTFFNQGVELSRNPDLTGQFMHLSSSRQQYRRRSQRAVSPERSVVLVSSLTGLNI
jgi:hypothetical protein